MKPYKLEEHDDSSRQSLLHHNDSSNLPLYDVSASKTHVYLGSLLFLVIGISPQLMENALFSETAVYVKNLPEHEKLSAYIISAFMLSNVTSFIYLVVQQYKKFSDIPFIYVILCGNLGISILLIYFWNVTEEILDLGQYSIAILSCSFIAGCLGNTSTLIFFGYASHYLPIFTTALSTGYGVSGIITSFLVIAQRPEQPLFSVKLYFGIMAIVICMSLALFAFIVHTRFGNRLRFQEFTNADIQSPPASMIFFTTTRMLLRYSWKALANMLWVSIITFWVPGLIPYLVLDHPRSQEMMSYLNGIFLVAPPLGAAFTGIVKCYYVTLLNMIESVLFFLLLFPVMLPTKDLISYPIWAIYLLMVVFALLSGYVTTMLYLLVRQELGKRFDMQTIEKISRWTAFANQVGAMLGTFGTDVLIRGHMYKSTA